MSAPEAQLDHTVVIVEPDPSLRTLLRRLLEERYRVVAASGPLHFAGLIATMDSEGPLVVLVADPRLGTWVDRLAREVPQALLQVVWMGARRMSFGPAKDAAPACPDWCSGSLSGSGNCST